MDRQQWLHARDGHRRGRQRRCGPSAFGKPFVSTRTSSTACASFLSWHRWTRLRLWRRRGRLQRLSGDGARLGI